MEKFNNRTPEFTKVFRELEGLSFSFPLLIINKEKIIAKLLGFLSNPSLKVVTCTVLDLIIAIVKDLRQDVYEPFINSILPHVIESIDASNLDSLDKIFSLLSFCLKYLIKSIRENLKTVFGVYSELLKHKSKYIRKFTS